MLSYLWSIELRDVSIDTIVALTKKTKKMVFSTQDLVVMKVFHQEKGYDNCFIGDHCNVHESILSQKLVLDE